jgi:hypothetical protein
MYKNEPIKIFMRQMNYYFNLVLAVIYNDKV